MCWRPWKAHNELNRRDLTYINHIINIFYVLQQIFRQLYNGRSQMTLKQFQRYNIKFGHHLSFRYVHRVSCKLASLLIELIEGPAAGFPDQTSLFRALCTAHCILIIALLFGCLINWKHFCQRLRPLSLLPISRRVWSVDRNNIDSLALRTDIQTYKCTQKDLREHAN